MKWFFSILISIMISSITFYNADVYLMKHSRNDQLFNCLQERIQGGGHGSDGSQIFEEKILHFKIIIRLSNVKSSNS